MIRKNRVERITKWADDVIATMKKDEKRSRFDSTIQLCGGRLGGVHIYKGLNEVAKALNCEVQYESRDDDLYDTEGFFIYKGVRFFSLGGK